MDKKGQVQSVLFFIFIVAGLIIITPIILKVGLTILDKTTTQFSDVQPSNQSANLVSSVRNTMANSFDWMVMLMVIADMLVLFVSAFLIDVHPAFVVFYIIGCLVIILTAPYSIVAAEKIYAMQQFNAGQGNPVQYLPMTQFLMNNFGMFILGVLIVTGILIYAKIKFFSQGGGGNVGY